MDSRFTSEFFSANRRRLQELFTGTAPIVIAANGVMQRGADNTYSFSQDANFWYLTGIDEPDLVLVIDRNTEYLIVPKRSAVREAFDGSVEHEALTRRSGIQKIYDSDSGWDKLNSRIKKVKHVATMAVPPAYVEHYGLYTNPARAAIVARIKQFKPEIELLDLTPHLTRMRMIKQPEEIQAIKDAIDITSRSIKQAIRPKKLEKYTHEYHLEAEITKGFRVKGASGHAFDPIIASGERGVTLHNVANNGAFAAGELVVIDVGAEVEHYAADITRTICLGDMTRRQQTVMDAVLDVQQYAFDLLKPGIVLKEYELEIEHYMGEKLRELGLIKTISHEATRQYYPHATSHFLGLNVHDVGEYDRPLEPGTVITVEPGIYIPEEAIGIRIEDDVLITEDGIQILTEKLAKNPLQ